MRASFSALRKFFHKEWQQYRQRNEKDRRPRVSSSRTPLFEVESLEPRLLMAADLAGAVQAHTLADPSVPTNPEQVTVRVINQGDIDTNTKSTVRVYASSDNVLDSSDVLLGSTTTPNKIKAGASTNLDISLNVPSTLKPASYQLLTQVDSTNVIAESNEANNVAVGPTFDVAWKFGAVPGRTGNTALTVRDSDGTDVTFTLSGPGAGEVFYQDGDHWSVVITGTDRYLSTFRIDTIRGTPSADIRVAIENVLVRGPLSSFDAPNMILNGSLIFEGDVGGVYIGEMRTASIKAPSMASLLIRGSVQGGNIAIDGRLYLLSVGGPVEDTTIVVDGMLGSLAVRGNVNNSKVQAEPILDINIAGTATGTVFFSTATPLSALVNGSQLEQSLIVDSEAPIITAQLKSDSGGSASDHLTNDPTIAVNVRDMTFVSLLAGVSADNMQAVYFGSPQIADPASMTISRADLETINGGPLADGEYTVYISGEDLFERNTQISITFTLDTKTALSLDLAPGSDTGLIGDQRTTAAVVTLAGLTDANALVSLSGLNLQTVADAGGNFSFPALPLALGQTVFTAIATDAAGNQQAFSRTVRRVESLVAWPDSKFTTPNTALTFAASDLTLNDSAPVDSVLTVTAVAATINTHGTVTLVDGVITYTPAAEFVGPASFEYVVNDNFGETITGIVNVTVSSTTLPPVINTPIPGSNVGTWSVGETVDVYIFAFDHDASSHFTGLTYSLVDAPPNATLFQVDARQGHRFQWVATAVGTYSATVKVADESGAETSVTFFFDVI